MGLTVSTSDGQLLMSGLGEVLDVPDDEQPRQVFVARLHAPYQWRLPNPGGCAHCAGSTRHPGQTTVPDYGGPDGDTIGGKGL